MRASYALILAAASLLVTSNAAVSGVTGLTHSKLSKVAPPAEVRQATVNAQRSLRSYQDVDSDDYTADDEKYDDEEEERGKPPFATERLEKALKSNKKLGKLLKQWDDNGYTLSHVAENVGVDVNGALDQKFMSLVTGYRAYQRGWRPQ
ncbi:unnamed protein product [Phytophthora lilii]|uniref:RxLR effector protein n=1 Tax=Phytophthora lilii TaxID=2077276 RepID=A0A9W7CI95_9STRA|nr:unnamed protein product [Phytophthora lilii]